MTAVPLQAGFSPAAIETLTGRLVVVTDMITLLELVGELVAHVKLEVNTQLTVSELFGVYV